MSATLVGVGCSFSLSIAGVADRVKAGWAEEEVGAKLGSAEGCEGLEAKRKAGG